MRKFFDLDIDSIIEEETKDKIKEKEITELMLNKLAEYRKKTNFSSELFL